MKKKDEISMFMHWTDLTKTCYYRYQQKLGCEGCPNNNKYICLKKPWNKNPYRIKNIKYAMLRTLANIGEPKMKICDCKKHIELDRIIDKALPNGDIVSTTIFKCTVCGKEFTEDEVSDITTDC